MAKIKILTGIYFLVLFIGSIILFNISIDINFIIETVTALKKLDSEYTTLQTKISIYSVIIFITLLLLSYILYFFTNKRNYIILSNILYVSVILYIYITVNKRFFEVQNIDYSHQGEYWVTIFMGVFYIIGAILVSSIGYITIRNYSKRSKNISTKYKRKSFFNN